MSYVISCHFVHVIQKKKKKKKQHNLNQSFLLILWQQNQAFCIKHNLSFHQTEHAYDLSLYMKPLSGIVIISFWAGCCAVRWFVTCVMSVVADLLLILVSLEG